MNSGYFNWRTFYTYVILLVSPLPKEEDLAVIERLADEEGFIYSDPFKNTAFWFDATESSKDPEYTHAFERRKMIKDLIF